MARGVRERHSITVPRSSGSGEQGGEKGGDRIEVAAAGGGVTTADCAVVHRDASPLVIKRRRGRSRARPEAASSGSRLAPDDRTRPAHVIRNHVRGSPLVSLRQRLSAHRQTLDR